MLPLLAEVKLPGRSFHLLLSPSAFFNLGQRRPLHMIFLSPLYLICNYSSVTVCSITFVPSNFFT